MLRPLPEDDATGGAGGRAEDDVSATACAPTALGDGLDVDRATRLARTLKALADPARLRLLSLIAASPTGEACVCDLTGPLGLGQPTVSHHCKVLVEAGFLRRDKRGVWAHFSVVPGAVAAVAAALPDLPQTAAGRGRTPAGVSSSRDR